MSKLLWALALFLSMTLLGFIGALGLHWWVRPELNAPLAEAPVTPLTESEAVLVEQFETARNQVADLEIEYLAAQERLRIEEGQARAVQDELTSYRDDRDRLFASIEKQNQQLQTKISDLEQRIAERLAAKAEQFPAQPELDTATLEGWLYYPHPLNNQSEIQALLRQDFTQSADFIEQHFALMLQPLDTAAQRRWQKRLTELAASITENEKHGLTPLQLHCTVDHCEVQMQWQAVQPYRDYWQQWLDAVDNEPGVQIVESFADGVESSNWVGALIFRVR